MTITRLLCTATLCASPAFAAPPTVVTDIAPVHSLVTQVMGDLGTPELLVSASDSPHSFSLRPSQAQALQNAGLVVWIGHALTPWLEEPVETLATNAHSLELLGVPGITSLMMRDDIVFAKDDHDEHDEHEGHTDHDDHKGHDEHKDHDGHDHGDAHDDHADHDDDHKDEAKDDHASHDHGHDHDGADPHAWLDPRNAAVWLSAIADELSEQDPDNAATYRANADSAAAKLGTLEEKLSEQLAPSGAQNFVVFHDAYHYFEDRFDLSVLGALSVSDATPPSPKRISELQAELSQVSCVFTEPQFNPGLVRTLVDGTSVGVAVLDPLGASLSPGPDLYGAVLSNMADQIANCVK